MHGNGRMQADRLPFWAVATLAALLTSAAQSGEPKPCADATVWANFQAQRKATKGTPTEGDVEYLYQYRVFLCSQVAAGRLTEIEATPLFDSERARLIRLIKQRQPKPGV